MSRRADLLQGGVVDLPLGSDENKKVVRGRIVGTEHLSEIVVESGKIRSVCKLSDKATDDDIWISPGFIDLQVNGWKGKNFNRPSVTPEDVREVVIREECVTQGAPPLLILQPEAKRKERALRNR